MAARRRWLFYALLVSAAGLLLAGCTVFAAQPAAEADPNAGGGRVGAEQAGQPQNPPGGADGSAVDDAGGGKTDPAEFAGEAAQPPQGSPAFPSVDLQPLRPGESATRGALTFTLDAVSPEAAETSINWQVSGLPGGYAPSGQEPVISIQLADGTLLQAVGAQGAVTGMENGAVETARMTFPALPGGTRAFTLLLPNAWSGTPETWVVPVVLE
jgi:hypothetical protein